MGENLVGATAVNVARDERTALRWLSSPSLLGRILSVGLVLALLSFAAFSGWLTVMSQRAVARMTAARTIADAYTQAQLAIANEASLDRAYRLQPAVIIESQHREAAALLDSSLETVRATGTDAALIDRVTAANANYLAATERLYQALDAGQVSPAPSPDGGADDPELRNVSELINGAASTHRAEVLAAANCGRPRSPRR